MDKIKIPKINYHVDRKSYLPAILAVILTSTVWYFSSHFSSEPFKHNLTVQIIFFLASFMANFITFDQLTNKTNLRLIAPLAVIPVAFFIILLVSKERYVSLLGLLTLVPFVSVFLPFQGKNGVGLISFAFSISVLSPIAFFYIRNAFVSSMFLKTCLLLCLVFLMILFSVFVAHPEQFIYLEIGLLVVITIFGFVLFKQWSAVLYPMIGILGWYLPRVKLPRNFILLVLIILICVTFLFTAGH